MESPPRDGSFSTLVPRSPGTLLNNPLSVPPPLLLNTFALATLPSKPSTYKKFSHSFQLEYSNLPINIFTDSNNAVAAITRQGTTPATRWLNNRYHFIRDAVSRNDVTLTVMIHLLQG